MEYVRVVVEYTDNSLDYHVDVVFIGVYEEFISILVKCKIRDGFFSLSS